LSLGNVNVGVGASHVYEVVVQRSVRARASNLLTSVGLSNQSTRQLRAPLIWSERERCGRAMTGDKRKLELATRVGCPLLQGPKPGCEGDMRQNAKTGPSVNARTASDSSDGCSFVYAT
jgi:hypothetical protein